MSKEVLGIGFDWWVAAFRVIQCTLLCDYIQNLSLWLLCLLWDSIRSFSYDALDLNLWPVSRNNTWVFVWGISIYYAFINNILLCNKSVHDYLYYSYFSSFKNIKYNNNYRIYIINRIFIIFSYDLFPFCEDP